MEKILFIDACISTHASRTKRLCTAFIEGFIDGRGDTVLETLTLRAGKVEPLTKERIIKRDGYVARKDWEHPMFDLAKQFKEADYIVIGAPYWDLSFPSILKVYVENIVVADLTFEATETGFKGLCSGKKLIYITSAGGYIGNKNFGYDYMSGIADMLGIDSTQCFIAEGLDIIGNDPDDIMAEACDAIEATVGKIREE